MKDNSIVITGSGVISSIGNQVETFSKNIFTMKTAYQQHKLLPSTDYIQHKIAYVNDQLLVQGISERQARKLDRFCLLAMQAFDQAYLQSKLSSDQIYPFGILLGNSTGGWSYVEPQMDQLYSGDLDSISPYVATAWFPTAPQGEISIKYKIAGYSKTFSAGTLSSGYALEHSMYLIRNNYLPGVFVGGVESPLSPLVYNAYAHMGTLSLNGKYSPYQVNSKGFLLGEGASISVVESYESCQSRKACPIVKVVSCKTGKTLTDAINACLEDSYKKAVDIDVVILDSKGLYEEDQDDLMQLNFIFPSVCKTYMCVANTLYGYLVGANFSFHLLVAILMIQKQKVPAGITRIDKRFLELCHERVVIKKSINLELRSVLIYSTDRKTKSCIAAIVEKP